MTPLGVGHYNLYVWLCWALAKDANNFFGFESALLRMVGRLIPLPTAITPLNFPSRANRVVLVNLSIR